MIDFTITAYRRILESLLQHGYDFIRFDESLSNKHCKKSTILRHDVDLLPFNSLRTAKLEAELGIKGTYYFRTVPESWNEDIIERIAKLGHEIGYHYENLTTCKGNIDEAYQDFCRNLERFRLLFFVKTICMHGSPCSPYDSKDIWKKYSYRDLGIIGEPYFDIDFSDTFYLTDTGRRWDGYKVSIRDRIERYQKQWIKEGLIFHSTSDILHAINENLLPNRIMITVHPQRWNSFGMQWCHEFVMQNIKNIAKRALITKRLLYNKRLK